MKKLQITLIIVFIISILTIPAYAASFSQEEAADALNQMGLFNGTGTDKYGNPIYDLDREPTRHEAITMLVRLLGKEEEALNGTWETPFTDVAEWAKPYVGYAYTNGLTNGTSDTTFGGDNTISATQYLTFILRVLGYKDGADFKWDAAWELTDQLGITSGEYADSSKTFLRGDVALISYNALSAKVNGTTKTLIESLENNSVANNLAKQINHMRVSYYSKNGLMYEGAVFSRGIYEFECNGITEKYISAGDLFSLLLVISDSYELRETDNPFLAGYIYEYSFISDSIENDVLTLDYGDFKYRHWDEYTSINTMDSWVEYEYNGYSCTVHSGSHYEDYYVSEQDDILCVSLYKINFVNINDVFEKLNIDGEFIIDEIADVGFVWSFTNY